MNNYTFTTKKTFLLKRNVFFQQKIQKKNPKKNKDFKDFGSFLKLGVELISAIIVGLVIGLFLDNYFQSKPIFLFIFLILGFAAGIMNVFRSVKKLGFEVGFRKKK